MGKVKPIPEQAKTPARVPVRIDAKTIIYVNPDQDLSKAKENYLASKSTLKGHQRTLFIGTK